MNHDDFLPHSQLVVTDDERWMYIALKEAKKAFFSDEVPVGAVVVYDGEIIGRGHNQVEMLQDATAHAEMLAMSAAAAALSNWRLEGCVLYTTLEPCIMCAGAALLSRVSRIVYGAPDIRHGAHGSLCNIFDLPHPTHSICVDNGVFGEWSRSIMQRFFKKRRAL